MEDESETFAKAMVLSIKSQPSQAKKPPTKYQDSLDSLEDNAVRNNCRVSFILY